MIKAIAIATLVAAQAPAAQNKCLSPAEATDLVGLMLPVALTSVANVCRSVLPQDAFLHTGTAAMIERARANMPPDERVFELVEKVGRARLPKGADPAFVSDLFGREIAKLLIQDIKPKDCPVINTVVEALEPLPPRNMARLFAALMSLGERSNDSPSITICESDR